MIELIVGIAMSLFMKMENEQEFECVEATEIVEIVESENVESEIVETENVFETMVFRNTSEEGYWFETIDSDMYPIVFIPTEMIEGLGYTEMIEDDEFIGIFDEWGEELLELIKVQGV